MGLNEKQNAVFNIYTSLTKKNCYVAHDADELPTPISTKIGGLGYLPIGTQYPVGESGKQMYLISQFNLNGVDLPPFPNKGILQVFFAADLDYGGYESHVRYYESTDVPHDENAKCSIFCEEIVCSLEKEEVLLPMCAFGFDEAFTKAFNSVYNTNYEDYSDCERELGESEVFPILSAIMDKTPFFTFGGYIENTQQSIELGDDEIALFSLSSAYDSDSIFLGDLGKMWGHMKLSDLVQLNFDNVTVDWDCT